MSKNAMQPRHSSDPSLIFVFGSNLAGYHGAGSAREAFKFWDAQWGCGEGPTGRAYAIPTKDWNMRTLPISDITKSVDKFLLYAGAHPELRFRIVAIGCGLAGYAPIQIAPLFHLAPLNCELPAEFRPREKR